MQATRASPARIALIGFGEAASAFVEGWRRAVSVEAGALRCLPAPVHRFMVKIKSARIFKGILES